MGSLARQKARNRVFDALEQRLDDAETQDEREQVYRDVIDELAKIGVDAGAIDDVAERVAVESDALDFPA